MITITIHRALDLIKKKQQQINKLNSNGLFVSSVKGSNETPTRPGFSTKEELLKRLQSDQDLFTTNIRDISVIKTTIAAKNLETKVSFLGKEVSITELLAIKQTKDLLRSHIISVRNQLTQQSRLISETESEIYSQVSKVDKSSAQDQEKLIRALTEIKLVTANPTLSPEAYLQALDEQEAFLNDEVDSLLSETNINTTIEVDI